MLNCWNVNQTKSSRSRKLNLVKSKPIWKLNRTNKNHTGVEWENKLKIWTGQSSNPLFRSQTNSNDILWFSLGISKSILDNPSNLSCGLKLQYLIIFDLPLESQTTFISQLQHFRSSLTDMHNHNVNCPKFLEVFDPPAGSNHRKLPMILFWEWDQRNQHPRTTNCKEFTFASFFLEIQIWLDQKM